MINSTLIKTENKSKADLEYLLNSIYLLPNWEKIKDFDFSQRVFFRLKHLNTHLYRKFSSKNMIEKYAIRTDDDNTIASMDLKVYKDSVYIISIDVDDDLYKNQIIEKLIQISIEKSLYNTTNKEVKINISFPFVKRHKVKHILESFGFTADENQSKYEINMFGETYVINAEKSAFWNQKIKSNRILINK